MLRIEKIKGNEIAKGGEIEKTKGDKFRSFFFLKKIVGIIRREKEDIQNERQRFMIWGL